MTFVLGVNKLIIHMGFNMTFKQRLGVYLIPHLPVNRRTFDILRFELNAFMTRILSKVDPRIRQRVQALANRDDLRLNLGSGGGEAHGWINMDVHAIGRDTLRWDIRRRLPFADGTVTQVYASHVVEHLEFREEVPALLAELYRVLKGGGSVRIVVPDAARYLEAYVTGDPDKWAALGMETLPDDMPTPMTMINHVFHQGGEHQFGYDAETLLYLLKNAGFEQIEQSQYHASNRFDDALDLAVHASYSLYVEAVKV